MLHINKIAIYIYTHTPCIRTLYRKTGPDLEPPANNIFYFLLFSEEEEGCCCFHPLLNGYCLGVDRVWDFLDVLYLEPCICIVCLDASERKKKKKCLLV